MGKSSSDNKIIVRHILEVRFRTRKFSFMDIRGEMIDYLSDKLDITQVRITADGMRFDIADDDLEDLCFFGTENFGFQSELNSSTQDFKDEVKEFLSVIKDFGKYYKVDTQLVRVGTKSIFFCHRKADNFLSLKETYKKILINDHEKIAKLTKSSIVDSAYTFDLQMGKSLANVLTGPVTKKEAIEKFFNGKVSKRYQDEITKENGMLVSIDVGSTEVNHIKDLEDLEKQIIEQIDNIEDVFNGFKELFDVKDK